ncbi:hypothetical protein HT121_15825 [Pseudomonas sp. MAFF 301514]|uniref:hypothetical protein n=1 Tax=Pseudomonas allii TaxID=2740531 RepID=UPI0015BD0849|nr:hypothetical protein [Pseudomonas allii]NWN48975.1 hypothetical protein [Pseudomonas allii]
MMNTLFTQALDIRVAYAKAVIFENKIDQIIYVIEAHILGATHTAPACPTYPSYSRPFPRSIELGIREYTRPLMAEFVHA